MVESTCLIDRRGQHDAQLIAGLRMGSIDGVRAFTEVFRVGISDT